MTGGGSAIMREHLRRRHQSWMASQPFDPKEGRPLSELDYRNRRNLAAWRKRYDRWMQRSSS